MTQNNAFPKAFIWRRLHSLTGLWLAIFLIEHLMTNSQAALWIGDDGSGFVRMVNWIKNLPYLPLIEIFLLGVPIVIHAVWGIQYLRTGQLNSFPSDGSRPSLSQYSRNHAYSWQRITSWILLFTLVGHIVQMRFMEMPAHADLDGHRYYVARVHLDEGLYTLAPRLRVQLFDQQMIEGQKEDFGMATQDQTMTAGFWSSVVDSFQGIFTPLAVDSIDEEVQRELVLQQNNAEREAFQKALEYRPLNPGQVMVVALDFGTAELLVVRETFKMPLMIVLYTIFVLSACFHGYNGLWTFLISWGISLNERSQRLTKIFTIGLMMLVTFFGLAAIWGTYFINLKS